jgi:hypothetical protein
MFSCAEILFDESINADRSADAAPLARAHAPPRGTI